ncbi:MAG: UDP-3-O-acyl-N-acetylglucosamine deacetylase [Leptolyngbyaceae cyanobacterium bins.59]|nr:UDP-3-O-acyl-N-acetylglucosamine deacetylase [Leptolyngbyaceae cyanobacterium bins.59]
MGSATKGVAESTLGLGNASKLEHWHRTGMNPPKVTESVSPSLPVSPLTQHTLRSAFERSGVGLHSGVTTSVRVLPAAPGTGHCFVRVDLSDAPVIPVAPDAVHQTLLSTELICGPAKVCTVEHLLSALTGLGVTNARIEVDGPELPLLDGSAREWAEAIVEAGWVEQSAPLDLPVLTEPIWITQQDAFVAAIPAPGLRFTYGIEFDLPAIGNQWFSWSPGRYFTPGGGSFVSEVAPARTFGLAHQIDALRAQGLIKGGSLENALVCGAEGWINPPLRFDNEPARHKLLDLVGDLSLLGSLPQAHFMAYKASHTLHTQLVRSLAQRFHNLR